jgi:integrase
MPTIPLAIQQYFDALAYGLDEVLPSCRVQNKHFLLSLYDALQGETSITEPDLAHLKTIKAMADNVVFPPVKDTKSCCEAEAYLVQTCPQLSKKQIRLALQWAFLLLARHGQIQTDLPTVEQWLRIWRLIQTFHPLEQGFVSEAVRWMVSKSFSPRSILDTLREYRKLKQWMADHEFVSIGQIGNVEIHRYLLSRACGKSNASKQKILGSLRSLFHYYKEAVEGGYTIPNFSVPAPRPLGVNQSASSQEIERLWKAIQTQQLPAMAGLMLVLILGHGLPLRALPLLKLTDQYDVLTYEERLPSRRGVQLREVCLNLNESWILSLGESYLATRNAPPDYPYLFSSGHGGKRKRPVSVEYCQRQVQTSVQGVLGYPIPANHLERGAIKQLARVNPLCRFMDLTSQLPKSRITLMMYWLMLHNCQSPS